MATILPLTVAPATSDAATAIATDIKNTLDARERIHALRGILVAQRKNALDAFLRAFCADLAALTSDPDKAFIDAENAKFNTWKAADDDLEKRIEALERIGTYVHRRFVEFESAYRDAVIALLTARIETLRAQLAKQEHDEGALYRRIEALSDELHRLESPPIDSAAAGSSAKTPKKSATKRARKRPAKSAASPKPAVAKKTASAKRAATARAAKNP